MPPEWQAFFLSVFVIAAFIVFVWFPGMIVMAFVCPSILYKRKPEPASILIGILLGLACSWLGIVVCYMSDPARKEVVRHRGAAGTVASAPAWFIFSRPGTGNRKRRGHLEIGSRLVCFKGTGASIGFPPDGIEALTIHNPDRARDLFPWTAQLVEAPLDWIVEVRPGPGLRRKQDRYLFAMDRDGAQRIIAGLKASGIWL